MAQRIVEDRYSGKKLLLPDLDAATGPRAAQSRHNKTPAIRRLIADPIAYTYWHTAAAGL
jgi:hypothetical protein